VNSNRKGANPCGARLSVAPRMIIRKKKVGTISAASLTAQNTGQPGAQQIASSVSGHLRRGACIPPLRANGGIPAHERNRAAGQPRQVRFSGRISGRIEPALDEKSGQISVRLTAENRRLGK
jgi:hypothetical protein